MVVNIITVFLCTTLYTVIRYVVFGNISPIHMPVYLLNKSVSMASSFLLLCAAVHHAKARTKNIKLWGMLSLHCAFIHILLSLSILSVAYYPKLFGTDQMNLSGEITVLSGVLAAYCYWNIHSRKSFFIQQRRLQLLSAFFITGHLAAMGFTGWLNVERWPGGLPPISLISCLFAIISSVLFLRPGQESFR